MILIGLLLLVEGLSTGLWLLQIVPMLPGLGVAVIVLAVLRALTGAMQTMGGLALLTGRRDIIRLCQLSLIASAMLTTLEIGARIAPSDLNPIWRWWLVGMYWIYALAAAGWLGRRRDGQVRGDKNQEVRVEKSLEVRGEKGPEVREDKNREVEDPDGRRPDVGD